MKFHKIHTLSVLCFAMVSYAASAQTISLAESRQFNISLLSTLDEYERTSSFSEGKDRYDFLRLFTDSESPCIYNDIIGSDGFQQMISPADYLQNIPEDGSILLRQAISDVRKEGDIVVENGMLHRKISFSKYMMIIDASVYTEGEGGILFDSSQLFNEEPDFRLLMDFAFDPSSGQCYISEILPLKKKDSSPLDDTRFTVVTRSSEKYDKQLTSGGKPLEFNDFNQSIAYYNDVVINNPDVYAEPIEYASSERYNVLGFKFKPLYFRFKAYGDMALGNAFDVSVSNNRINHSSKSFQFGMDFGFELSMNQTWRTGLYAGVGLSVGKIGLSILDLEYTLQSPLFVRPYNISASEDLKLMDFLVPVYVENEFSLANNLVLDIDLGARFYLNHNTKLEPYHVYGRIAGIEFDQHFTKFLNPTNYTRSSYDIAIFGNVEVDYCIITRLLYAYLSFGYEQGLKPSYDSELKPYFNPDENIYPMIYSISSDKDNPFRSLIGAVSYQRKSGWISAGLKFKF